MSRYKSKSNISTFIKGNEKKRKVGKEKGKEKPEVIYNDILNGVKIEFKGKANIFNEVKKYFSNLGIIEDLLTEFNINITQLSDMIKEYQAPIYIYFLTENEIIDRFGDDEDLMLTLFIERALGMNRNIEVFPEVPIEIFIVMDHERYKQLKDREIEKEIIITLIHEKLAILGKEYIMKMANIYGVDIPKGFDYYSNYELREELTDEISEEIWIGLRMK